MGKLTNVNVGYRNDDCGKGRVLSLLPCLEMRGDQQSRFEETGLPLHNKLCEDLARSRCTCSEHFPKGCKGESQPSH